MAYIGIDLGTTFSAMAYLDSQGMAVTVANAEGELTTPSVVLFEPGGEVVVGREAHRAALAEPGRVVECVKRYMGDEFFPRLIDGQKISPVQVSALILKKLRQDVEMKIGKIEGAVITVPAYFDEGRRQATAAAGDMAGLKILDIINEPTSAALAYAFRSFIEKDGQGGKKLDKFLAGDKPRVVVVYDLGGGTFDVTVMKIVGKEITVLATAGDVQLGGRDWDERLFSYMADIFMKATGLDPRDDAQSRQALYLLAEDTKRVLSQRKQAKFTVNHAGQAFTGEITRDQFVQMTEDLLYRTESRLSRVIGRAKLKWDQVDEILAVGGSTRMPQVQDLLRRISGKEPNFSLSPDEVVAHGAAIHAAMCAVKGKSFSGDSKKPDLAKVETDGGVLGLFKRKVLDLLQIMRTTNVNSHSLGVVVEQEDSTRRVSMLIPADTQLPVSIKRRFGTATDSQSQVIVRVVEGESRVPDECIPVGACRVRPLPPGLPKGSPVEVTFTYDNSGRLHIEALEVTSGTWAKTSIERRAGIAEGNLTANKAAVAKTAVK